MAKINHAAYITVGVLAVLLAAWRARGAGELGKPSAIEITSKGEDNARATTTATFTINCAKVILCDEQKCLVKLLVDYQNTSASRVQIDYKYAALKDDRGLIYRCGKTHPYQSKANGSSLPVPSHANPGLGEAGPASTFINEIYIPQETPPDAWGEKNENKYFINCEAGATVTNSAVFEVQTTAFSGNVYFGFVSPFDDRLVEGQVLIYEKSRSTLKFKPSKFVQDGSVSSFWKDTLGGRRSFKADENHRTFQTPVWSETVSP